MQIFLQLFLFLFAICHLSAQDCGHSHKRTQNTLAPDVRFTLVPRSVTNNSAVAFLAEAGRRNFRLNGTFGFLADCENRFKISGEYLQQKLGYNYSTGLARRWVRQFACGVAYEHDFCNQYITSAEISAYCSYAPTRHLSSQVCENYRYYRRIAGATAYGGEIGSTIRLWPCAFLYLDANYDSVIYHRRFYSNRHVEGFGGSVGFHQQLFETLGFDLRAEFRRPFNYYRASVCWSVPQWTGLTVGVYGSHTRGKCRLPSSTMAGIELNYTFADFFRPSYNDCGECEIYCSPDLACWVSRPAVYLPEVLAIAEEKAVRLCSLPGSIPIPNVVLSVSGPFAIDVSPYFINPDPEPLVFSATGLPPGAVIDPVTGIITGVATSGLPPFVITVFASNNCGSASQTFALSYCTSAPISTTIPDVSLNVTGPFAIDVSPYFVSPEGTPLTFTATGLPPGATIDPVTGIITGVATSSLPPFAITVTATNACGSSSQTFTLTYCSNLPTSTAIPPFATCLTGPFSYPVGGSFTNPPGSNPLVFSATGLPVFATIDPATGTISGVNPDDANVYNVTVTADNGCGSTSQPLVMTFTCPAPTSSPIPNQSIPSLQGDPYTLDVVTGNFTSPCGQTFTFTATGLPPGSSINPVTGLISGTANVTQVWTVTIFGTTSCGQTSQTFQLDFSSS